MPLLQRVAKLIRANLNELIEKAENPEVLLKQLVLDLQNQHMQVKTQVAMAIANQHLLEKKRNEALQSRAEANRQAELALARQHESLARAALDRSLTYETAAANFGAQLEDQAEEVRLLRDALARLETKLAETRARADLLITQHRRARNTREAAVSRIASDDGRMVLDRAERKVRAAGAEGLGALLASAPTVDEQLASLDREDRIDRLLAELKTRAIGDGGSS